MTAQKKEVVKKSQSKTRGTGVTIWLILLVLQSALAIYMIQDLTKRPEDPSRPFILAALFLLSAVKLAGVLGIWLWKRWGLYIYLGSVVGVSIIGLVLTGNPGILFFELIPVVITGWLLKDKYPLFQ